MKDWLLGKFNIPNSCKVGNTIFKKLFYENATMNKLDKDIFQNHVAKIIWLYAFKADTINIQPYKDNEREYEEIAFLIVDLNNDLKVKRISEIIQRTIPYPLVVLFFFGDKVLFNVSHKRINLADASKNTVEELIYTDWLDLSKLTGREEEFLNNLNISEFSFNNFYIFYSEFVDRINLFNASVYEENYQSLKNKDAGKVKELTEKINNIEAEIIDLRNKLKKENHFNKKIQININIKKLEEQRNNIIKELK